MVIEQQITGAIIAGIKELYGADVTASQVQLQKTKKEFKGHLTLVVFPFLRMSKKSPEQTAQEIGEYLLSNEPAVADGRLLLLDRFTELDQWAARLRYHSGYRAVAFGYDRIFFSEYK